MMRAIETTTRDDGDAEDDEEIEFVPAFLQIGVEMMSLKGLSDFRCKHPDAVDEDETLESSDGLIDERTLKEVDAEGGEEGDEGEELEDEFHARSAEDAVGMDEGVDVL